MKNKLAIIFVAIIALSTAGCYYAGWAAVGALQGVAQYLNGGVCTYAVYQATYQGYWDITINGRLYHVDYERCPIAPLLGRSYKVWQVGNHIKVTEW